MILKVIGKYIIISMVICFLYGINILSIVTLRKFYKEDFKGSYLFQLWSLVLFLIIWYLSPLEIFVFEVHNLWSLKNILLIFVAVIPTSIIIYKGKSKLNNPLKNFLNGATMEIPQRLLTQNLFAILGVNTVVYGELTSGIVLNALIWVQFIIVQEIINKKKISFKIVSEITASFWFSIWVGILYSITGNIVIAMVTHGLQRVVTHEIRKRMDKHNNELKGAGLL